MFRFPLVLFMLGGLAAMAPVEAIGQEFTLVKGLSSYQVFQRDAEGRANIVMSGTASAPGLVRATVSQDGMAVAPFDDIALGEIEKGEWTATLREVPTGGPYQIEVRLVSSEGAQVGSVTAGAVLVGDLWLLAGQSNMQGIGDMIEVEAPSDRVGIYRMRHEWDRAIEPIHRLYESPDPVHLSGEPPLSREEADKKAASETKGSGLGLPFAKQMVARTGVPIGLVPTGHGGTSMAQWDPSLKDQGGDSLYGSMLKSLHAVGGKVAGVLWYQGESDSGSKETVEAFSERFKNLVAAIREDAGDPDLPFYYVQISRFVLPNGNHDGWNAIQEQQRLLEEEIPNCGVVAAVDLALDDLIHIGTPGLKRLGKRLANLAVGATHKGPRLSKVERVPGGLRVSYSEVNGRLLPEGRVAGFSIRDASGQDLCLIYKQEVDLAQPTSVLLSLTGETPAGAKLYYGYGLDPFCNLTDSEDMAALAFGPYDLSE